MSSDEMLIRDVAQLWIENGGDAEGVEWCWRDIRDKVAEMEAAPLADEQESEQVDEQD